jgi:tRNA A58 N-methylase Trm61
MAIKRMTKADHPQSFGAFKPVGHVVVAMPDDERAAAAVRELRAAGFEAEDILEYTAAEEDDEMDRMLADATANGVAGFGYEVSLMRRYQELAREGASWLIVFAPDSEQASRVAEVTRTHGALIAEKYHRLVIEDLI